MTLTKSGLVKQISTMTGLPQHEVVPVLEVTLGTIISCLAQGKRVELRGLGAFGPRDRKARSGRNIQTGEKVPIQRKTAAVFRPGRVLRKRVNDSRGEGNL